MEDARALSVIRRYLLGVIALVLFGLLLELIMLSHLNTPLQLLDGLMVHYNFAAHAALKSHPALVGLPLLYATLSGDIPLLAPGMMIEVGLLGLLYTFHHPLDVHVGPSVGSLRLRG